MNPEKSAWEFDSDLKEYAPRPDSSPRSRDDRPTGRAPPRREDSSIHVAFGSRRVVSGSVDVTQHTGFV
jgi:hypothetical protein